MHKSYENADIQITCLCLLRIASRDQQHRQLQGSQALLVSVSRCPGREAQAFLPEPAVINLGGQPFPPF